MAVSGLDMARKARAVHQRRRREPCPQARTHLTQARQIAYQLDGGLDELCVAVHGEVAQTQVLQLAQSGAPH